MTEIIISVFFVISVIVGAYYSIKNNKIEITKKTKQKPKKQPTLKKKLSKRKTVGSPRKKTR